MAFCLCAMPLTTGDCFLTFCLSFDDGVWGKRVSGFTFRIFCTCGELSFCFFAVFYCEHAYLTLRAGHDDTLFALLFSEFLRAFNKRLTDFQFFFFEFTRDVSYNTFNIREHCFFFLESIIIFELNIFHFFFQIPLLGFHQL